MQTTRCDLRQCYWNKNGWCSRTVTILNNGTCSQILDKNGNQKNPNLWQHPIFDEDQSK